MTVAPINAAAKKSVFVTFLLAIVFVEFNCASGQPVPGTVLWTYDAGTAISSSSAITPDGAICFGTASGVTAITNAGASASNKWTFAVGQLVSSSPAVALDGTVYFLKPGAGCYALNPDGSEKWSYPFQATGLSSPAIGADGTIYVVGDSSLHALSPKGASKWSYNVSSQDGSPVIAPDGTIYVATGQGSSLYAVNPDGTQKWASIGGSTSTGESAAIGADGTIYITRGALSAFVSDGSALWTSPTSNFNMSSPVIGENGIIYVVQVPDRSLCSFTPQGQAVWSGVSGGWARYGNVTAPAIASGGTIYYCVSNSVLALSAEGAIRWVVTGTGLIPPSGTISITSPVIGTDGTIYAALGTKLYAIAGTNAIGNTPWPMFRQNPRHTGRVEKPTLKQPQKRSDANFQFQLYGQVGQTYTIEESTNLNTWTSLTSVVATALPTDVADLTATNSPLKFYRASSPP